MKSFLRWSFVIIIINSTSFHLSQRKKCMRDRTFSVGQKMCSWKQIFLKNRISRKYEKAFCFNMTNFFYFPISIFCYNGNKWHSISDEAFILSRLLPIFAINFNKYIISIGTLYILCKKCIFFSSRVQLVNISYLKMFAVKSFKSRNVNK